MINRKFLYSYILWIKMDSDIFIVTFINPYARCRDWLIEGRGKRYNVWIYTCVEINLTKITMMIYLYDDDEADDSKFHYMYPFGDVLNIYICIYILYQSGFCLFILFLFVYCKNISFSGLVYLLSIIYCIWWHRYFQWYDAA